MKLYHLTDETLDEKLVCFVQSERELLTEILHHLAEADRRRLFSKFGFKSLFEYTVKRFGYSEDQAYRRISAMRLLKEIPAIEEKIESGALSLSNIAQVQTLFRAERKEKVVRSFEEKLVLLEKLENLSKREATTVLEREAQPVRQFHFDCLGVATNEKMEFFSSPELKQKLTRLFEVTAHTNPYADLAKLIDHLADLALAKLDPLEKAKRHEKRLTKRIEATQSSSTMTSAPAQKHCVTRRGSCDNRRIAASTKHAVFLRDQGKCQKCGSGRALEIDHILPFAKGGEQQLVNLRLLCRSCNQRHAIETYGLKKMSSFLKTDSRVYH